MRKLITLKQTWVDPKGLKKSQINEARDDFFDLSIKAFKDQMSDLWRNKSLKIIKEIPPDSLLVEYDDKLEEQMWVAFRAAEIVETVDSNIAGI